MCHESPTSQFIGCMVTTIGCLFILWHIWTYDKGKCLVFRKKSAFRWVIVWMFITSMFLFEAWNVILVYVKYKEYYMEAIVNNETIIEPVPYTLWSETRQKLVRNAYQLLAIAWFLVLSIHSEETLYWAYLIGAIRSRDSRTWYNSIHFKIWIVFCVSCAAIMPAIANMETTNLVTMEGNIFLAGSISALILFVGSIWLLVVFPRFIKESRSQGANSDVLGRLQYFKELNTVRTLFRLLYCVAILTLAIDSRTSRKYVNTHPFWLDLFYICGLFFVFSSNALSLMILLPRNMAEEAGYLQSQQVFVRQNRHQHLGHNQNIVLPSSSTINSTMGKFAPYSPTPPGDRDGDTVNLAETGQHFPRRASRPWGALGERLNIDKRDIEDVEAGIAMDRRHKDRNGESSKASHLTADSDKPFAMAKGERVFSDDGHMEEPARILNHFRSPADFRDPPKPRDLNIIVMTDTVEVHEKS